MRTNYLKTTLAFGLLAITSIAYANDDNSLKQLIKTQVLQGYLTKSELPDSKVLLPPPPQTGSVTLQNDIEINKRALSLQNSLRWKQAAVDSDLFFPRSAKVFSCAADVDISQENTPTLYKLLQKSMVDLGTSVYKAKEEYQRARPFMENGQDICHLNEEEKQKVGLLYQETKAILEKDGSYPSGHSAIGWGWALILSEIVPDRQDHILMRGRTFAESRVICNVHWQSDIIEGKLMGSTAVATLHANKDFLKDVEKAKREIEKARKLNKRPDPQVCAKEQEALSVTIKGIL